MMGAPTVHASKHNPGEVTIGNFTYTKAFWDDYKAGYAFGIIDYDKSVNDHHDLICPYENIAPDSKWCKGYNDAIEYETSD